MARIFFVLSFLLVVLIVLTSVVFIFRNDGLVEVDFFFTQTSSLSLGFWMLSSLGLGLFLGLLCSLPSQIFLSSSKKIKDRKLQESESKLHRLKSASAKG